MRIFMTVSTAAELNAGEFLKFLAVSCCNFMAFNATDLNMLSNQAEPAIGMAELISRLKCIRIMTIHAFR
jgi:hypothetical protein